PLKKVSVRIAGDRVTKIGIFKPAKGEQVIDAQGLVVAPGFIDIHNHSAEGLDKAPLAETQISQGITTVILGPDGFSPWPIGGWMEARRIAPAGLNAAPPFGHSTAGAPALAQAFRRASTA